MIDRLIQFSLQQRFLILIFAVLVVGLGVVSLKDLPIDAFPDVTNIQVQVNTEAPGLAPVEVEKLITFPVESVMNGLPGVTQVRSLSKFGLSVVTVVFTDQTDIYFARQLVLERLQIARERIPPGLGDPEMGPISTGMGQIYMYVVQRTPGEQGSKGAGEQGSKGANKLASWRVSELARDQPTNSPTHPSTKTLGTSDTFGTSDLITLRTLQDWVVKYQLRTVPGVTDILSFGGQVKQYQVLVDPDKLIAYHVHLRDVFEALARSNANTGGGYIEHGAEQYIVRGVGLLTSLEDIRNIVVAEREGTPIYIKNVAEVVVGPEVRQGAVTMNGQGEVVTGIVLQLKGENSRAVIRRVQEKVQEINQGLPAGVQVQPYYDQAELVNKCIDTVREALIEGLGLVVIVLILFLGNLRSALIVALNIPLSALICFTLMRRYGLSANLMSLGGLAIGIGMLVDGSVVMVENIFRHLSERPGGPAHFGQIVLDAAQEVGRPIVFAITIIIVVFLPLFTLQGIEGKMFAPMAFTISFAMLGSLVLSLTLAPALCSLLLRGPLTEKENPLLKAIKRGYLPLLRTALTHRGWTVGVAGAALLLSLLLVPRLGSEFLPELDEGSLLIRVTMLPSISLSEATAIATKLEKILLRFPEVETVVSRVGRAELGGDPEDVNNNEIYVGLKPRREWRTARTKEGLVEAYQAALGKVPGLAVSFSQPIATRVDELISGVRAQVAIKLFGEDLDTLVRKAAEIQRVMATVRGVADLQVEKVTGSSLLQITIDRPAIARYGINVADVQEAIETALGGRAASQVIEGEKRFDLFVRLPERVRQHIERIGNLLIESPSDEHIPLGQLAKIAISEGPVVINHEHAQRRIVVQCNVRGRDMGSFVAEGQRKVRERVKLPPGYFVTWGGQFESQQRAMARLSIVVPVTIGLIFVLLFTSFNSLKNAGLIIMNIPFALIGGIVALWLRGMHLSVSASVGFIALFGVAVLNGVVLVSYFNQLRRQGRSIEEAVIEGVQLRLRPVLMTALVAALGLIPLMFTQGTGSEVQKPLATVVVGGLVTSTLLTLVVLPTLYGWFEREEAEVEV